MKLSKEKKKMEPKMIAGNILGAVGALFAILWIFLTLVPIIMMIPEVDEDLMFDYIIRLFLDPYFFLMIIPLAISSSLINEVRMKNAPSAAPVQKTATTYYTPPTPSPQPASPVKEVIIKEKKIMHVLPHECPNCGAKISDKDVRWVGPLRAACPYCDGEIYAEEREL